MGSWWKRGSTGAFLAVLCGLITGCPVQRIPAEDIARIEAQAQRAEAAANRAASAAASAAESTKHAEYNVCKLENAFLDKLVKGGPVKPATDPCAHLR